MKNQAKFKELMTVLSELFDKPLSELITRIYWKTLDPFTDAECQNAFETLIQTSRFFPKPADFLELLVGKKEDRAALAWLKVAKAIRKIGTYQSVRFDDPVIHSVIQAMGGWIKLGQMLEKEVPFKQKEFERLYTIMAGNGKHPDYLPGISERDNTANGYDQEESVIAISDDRDKCEVNRITMK